MSQVASPSDTLSQRPASHKSPLAVQGGATPAGEFLRFRLGAEEYGIDILRVQEIRSYQAPARIAHAPPFVKGVINLRGAIIPIVDLRMKMNCATAAYDDSTVVVVLNVRDRIVGAVVDSVSDVLELHADQIKQAPQFNAQVQAGHIVGIASVTQAQGDRMLILLDIEALMSSAELGLFEAAH